jgi:hypothetical protein
LTRRLRSRLWLVYRNWPIQPACLSPISFSHLFCIRLDTTSDKVNAPCVQTIGAGAYSLAADSNVMAAGQDGSNQKGRRAMKSAMLGTACLMSALFVTAPTFGQDLGPRQVYRGWFSRDSSAINSERPRGGLSADGLDREMARLGDGMEPGVARPESSKGVASPVRASFEFDSGNSTAPVISHDMPRITGCDCGSPGCGLHRTRDCFPHNSCPDDYQPKPLPRLCWPTYPSYYRCVPAGDSSGPTCGSPGKDRLTWWFIPTPWALRDALWLHP